MDFTIDEVVLVLVDFAAAAFFLASFLAAFLALRRWRYPLYF